MKIGLMTIDPYIMNYGGILQEYALYLFLSQYYTTEIIDYSPSLEKNTFSIKRDIRNFNFDRIINHLLYKRQMQNVIKQEDVEYYKRRKEEFELFRLEKMKFSKKYNSNADYFDYQYIFCGSDQIWNPDFNIPAFFLDVNTNAIKAIYAASIGKSELTKRQKKIYAKYINNLNYVSCREQSAVELLSPLVNVSIECVLDPTLLISRTQWDELTLDYEFKDDYIFVYFLGFTEDKIKAVERFAKLKSMKIVSIPFLHGANDTIDFNEYVRPQKTGPNDFISLIKYARYVITDSFHAAVFSCIYEKDFCVFGRKSGTYSMNTRIDNLLNLFGCSDRLTNETEFENVLNNKLIIKKTNYDSQYKKSVNYIEKVIAEGERKQI